LNLLGSALVVASLIIPVHAAEALLDPSSQSSSNPSLVATPHIAKPLKAKTSNRYVDDQPDKYDGLQIRAIYVVPKGERDRNLDTNGTIERYLKEGNRFLKKSLGETFRLDTRMDGSLDIGFWNPDDDTKAWPSSDSWVSNHGEIFDRRVTNRKHYVFFQEGKASGLCGSNDLRNGSIIYLGSNCKGPLGQVKNFQSVVWIHEVFHNFGAVHTSPRVGVCELMASHACGGRPSRVRIQLKLKGYKGLYPIFTSGGVWSGNNLASQLRAEETCTAILVLPHDPYNRFLVCPIGARALPTGISFVANSDAPELDWVMEDGITTFPLSLSNELIKRNGLSVYSVSFTKNEVGVTVMRPRTAGAFSLKTTIFWRK
jgi:hypothetical protein